MGKKLIIVGAGISGLSAGNYAQRNGYSTTIFEMHSIPGGLCTAWEKKGYKFDVSMHMLTGSVSGPFHEMWKELGVIDRFDFHFHDLISRVEAGDASLSYVTDRAEFEQALVEISPEDADLSREFVKLIFGPDMMNAASLKPKALQNIGDSLRMMINVLPLFRVFGKYNKMTLQEFAAKFKHPFLRDSVRFFIDAPGWPMKEFPMIALAGFVRSGVTEAGVPLGGSQQVMFHLADRFEKSGGEIHYKAKVKDLVIESGKVNGIELEDGTKHMADEVVWAADGHSLIYDILDGKYISEEISEMYKNWMPVKPIIHVALGINRDMSGEPHRLIFEADPPIIIAGREHRWIPFMHHCYDQSMAPEGKSAVEVWYDTEYEYWEELRKDRKAYKAEKKRIADYTVRQLERRWPGIANDIEVVDVPTPATYTRYTGNWQASPDGWYITPKNMRKQEPVRTLPGLEGLQMVGQWTAPFTGTVIAALTGRQAVQLMCKRDGKRFVSSIGNT